MSIKHMDLVWRIDGLKSNEKIVLLFLANCSDDEGVSWPSLEGISEKCGVSEGRARGAIASLKEKSLIWVGLVPGARKGRKKRYHLTALLECGGI